MNRSLFSNRKLCIATMHGKEEVIAPLLESALGVECFVPEQFNTDKLGTFSGEVERKTTPVETAREKCLQAMQMSGCDLALASEGSFGNHPALFFVPADEEFLVLIDTKNNLQIVAHFLTTDTNFGAEKVDTWEQLLLFAKKVHFPEHGLILKNVATDWSYISKGILNEIQLNKAFIECHQQYGEVFVETDMRAMHNPLRMQAIATTTQELIRKIQSECPSCKMPGFDITERKPGLPCEQCSLPTKSTLCLVYKCSHCDFKEIIKFPKGKEREDPMYCDFCNP